MKQALIKHAEWLWRLAALALLVAVLWLNSNYVRKIDFQAYQANTQQIQEKTAETIQGIKETLIRIDEKMRNDERQDQLLGDHEARLRQLERPASR